MMEFIQNEQIVRKILTSLFFIFSYVLAHYVLKKTLIKVKDKQPEKYKKWVVGQRNALVVVAFLSIGFIWATELKALALSLVAVAAAIVVGSKEYLLCLLGGFYRITSRSFELGDIIEIDNYKGKVTDASLLSTTIFELKRDENYQYYSGKQVKFPNSILLSKPAQIQDSDDYYIFHTLNITEKNESKLEEKIDLLISVATEETSLYIDTAKSYFRRKLLNEGITVVPSIEPKAIINSVDPEKISIKLRFPTPKDKINSVEQKILFSYLKKRQAIAAQS